jgi:hypothetical protein
MVKKATWRSFCLAGRFSRRLVLTRNENNGGAKGHLSDAAEIYQEKQRKKCAS